jgi:SulP family sulfate permease
LLGIKTAGTDAAFFKFIAYFKGGFQPDWHTLLIGSMVMLTMLVWPRKWNARFPSSLAGIILATGVSVLVGWPIASVSEIPQTLFLADHLSLANIPWVRLPEFIAPAITITALGAVESLLCGTVASNMTGIRLQANQELIAQGAGNILIPFFGGVPATAAIARTSVGIKSGGQTRLVSIVHALAILLSMFVLAPVMSKVPLAALAGVLMVTAWRMNEWHSIRFIFGKAFKTDILAFLVTLVATITLDLTKAIIIGTLIAGMLFINKISSIEINVKDVDPTKLRKNGIETKAVCQHVRVGYLTGPLFFAAVGQFNETFANLSDIHALILSMRGVPLIDTAGLEAIHRLHTKIQDQGGRLMLAGVHDNVRNMMERADLVDQIGADNFFWSADLAIVEAEGRPCRFCEASV